MAVDKRRHGNRGDILVDDTLKQRHLWEAMGGTFVHHRDVDTTLGALRELGFEVRDFHDRTRAPNRRHFSPNLRQAVEAGGTLSRQKRLFHAYPPGSLEEESMMAQNNQQGGNQPNQNPGQQEQQDGQRQNQQGQNPGQGGGQQEQQNPQRRQPGQDNDQGGQNDQAGRDDENRRNR